MSGAGLHDHRLATATVQRRYYYPRCAARDARSRTPVTRPLFAAIAIATVMSVQGGQRAVEQSQCSCANYAGRREQLGVAPARIGKTRRVG